MSLKGKLATKTPLIGTFLKSPSSMICEVLGRTDLDVVCIDAEHSPFDRQHINDCILALNSVNKSSLVRVQSNSSEHILNALDCGASGVLVPHIATAEDATNLVNMAYYGKGRGYAGSSRAAGYGGKSMPTHKSDSNQNVVVIAQIEDAEALDNLDDIFAVEGIDAFFIGRADLTISLGLENPNDDRVIDAVEEICRKGHEYGRTIGMFTAKIDEISMWREKGASLFLLESDHAFMVKGAALLTEKVRKQF